MAGSGSKNSTSRPRPLKRCTPWRFRAMRMGSNSSAFILEPMLGKSRLHLRYGINNWPFHLLWMLLFEVRVPGRMRLFLSRIDTLL